MLYKYCTCNPSLKFCIYYSYFLMHIISFILWLLLRTRKSLTGQLDHRNPKSDFSRSHLQKLQSESFPATRNTTNQSRLRKKRRWDEYTVKLSAVLLLDTLKLLAINAELFHWNVSKTTKTTLFCPLMRDFLTFRGFYFGTTAWLQFFPQVCSTAH